MPSCKDLADRVLNSLAEQIAVIDKQGAIVYTNASWADFGRNNGFSKAGPGPEANYLQVLRQSAGSGDHLAAVAIQGIFHVIQGDLPTFYHEYPCHSPTRKRWFMMRVCPVRDSSRQLLVISHHDITVRKLAEQKAHYLSQHDFLTELANRRYFHHHLHEEIGRCAQQQEPISLILLDVDRFKEYNDSLGHQAGDTCLKQIAGVIKKSCNRTGDLAARMGGDEFALILPNTSATAAEQLATSIQGQIETLDLRHIDKQCVTVSVGIVAEIPDTHTREDNLLERADQALLLDKARGSQSEQQ